jgi:hypothetical protein
VPKPEAGSRLHAEPERPGSGGAEGSGRRQCGWGMTGEVRRWQTLPPPGCRPLRGRRADGIGGAQHGTLREGGEGKEMKSYVLRV